MASTETDKLDDQVAVTGGTLAILASKLATSPVVRLLFILAQLGLLTIIIRQFQIESAAFLRIALIAFAGFTVHHFLPKAYKLPFFAILSLGAIVLVLGIESGIILIGLGVALLTLCHLPVAYWARVALLLLAGATLAFVRSGAVEVPSISAVWPILGAMFMFRLIVYMYDLRHDKGPVSFWRSLSYFFLLPNVCFPLFPVVDYKTFRRTYSDRDAFETYQVGVNWMLRGVTHLILYRIIYYYVALAPSEVVTLRDLVQYLVSNFLLYLRVSGQFHIIIGMLHLFGFNLPETNHKYCLSSSFTDFWRRINIYWKDFMLKVFYYPAYFKLKNLGETKALVLATVFTFAVTWALHSYQWFWLRGSVPLRWQDAVFWTVLATLVVANSLYEMKFGRQRSLGRSTWTLGSFANRTLKTIGTFTAVVVLWSLWTSETFSGWLSMWSVTMSVGDLVIPALILVLIAVAGVVSYLRGTTSNLLGSVRAVQTTVTFAILVPLMFLGLPQVYTRLGSGTASVVATLKSGKLSRLDMAALEKGYYEDLMAVNHFNSHLWEVYMNKPLHWLDIQGTGLVQLREDFLQRELPASLVSTDSFGTTSTNRWGMRDKDYDQRPSSDTYRMALLGASTSMGWGVNDGETYESLVEARLNADATNNTFARYEILNFAVPGYFPLQQAVALDKALSFEPRALLYIATGRELSRAADYLASVATSGIEIPFPELQAIAESAGLEPGMNEDEALRRLLPVHREILGWLYEYVVKTCRTSRVRPIWVFIPQLYGGTWEEETDEALELAQTAGFAAIDLREVYDGHDTTTLRLAEWDDHPNARGHELLANRLYKELREDKDMLNLGTRSGVR